MNKIKLKLINILLLSIMLFGITILSNTFYTAIKVEGSETFSCPIHYTSLSLDLEKSTETCHKYYCELCSQYYEEDHNFEDGKCSICNYKCTHKSGYTLDGKCSICGSLAPFSITYNLDGGTLENFVSTYYYTSSEIVLSSPTKDGFRFLGWYDNSLLDGNTLTTIPTHSLGDKEVYASWYKLESIVVDETLQVSTYDGKEKEFSILGSFSSLDGFYIEYSKTTLNSFSSILPKTAGIYDVKITRNQDDYYLQFNKVIEGGLVINKAVASIDTSGVIKDYTYNDEFQTVDSGAKLNHNETTLKYLNNTFINVGTGKYIITIKAEETENFLPIEKQIEITVKKLKVEEPIVIGEYIYTGEPQYVVLYGEYFNAWKHPIYTLETP